MQLPSPFLKILKWIHVSFVSILFGAIVSMAYLFFIKKLSAAGAQEDYFIFIIFESIVTYSFFALIITAFIYGNFSKWRFFLHHWILLKWILAFSLFALVWLGWGPSINGLVALTDGQFQIPSGYQEYLDLNQKAFLLTLSALTLVWFILLISILKPWGMLKARNVLKERMRLIISTTVFLIMVIMMIGSSIGLNYYRNITIQDSDFSHLSDGDYTGQVEMGGFTYILSVEIDDNRIQDIRILNNRNSSYSRHAEAVLFRIIEHQNANVAGITGATTSSKVLMKAVENALR